MEPKGLDTGAGLPDSRLYTFLDGNREFALYLLEGQRLIHDLALVHPIRGRGFAYFRDVVLSIQLLIALLKRGEQFGFYIDSEEPFFRLKIETGHHGATRCTLMPEEFEEFPEALHGVVRLQKVFPYDRPPYDSFLHVEGLALREIVNRVLRESYQVNSAVLVSQRSDQSVMLHQLPPLPGKDEYEYSPEAMRARREEVERDLREILAQALTRPERIERAFAQVGFRLLASRPVVFRCSCSKDRVLHSLGLVCSHKPDELFDPGQQSLEVTCEYCKSRYHVGRDELERSIAPPH